MHISSAHKSSLAKVARIATAGAMVVGSLTVSTASGVDAAQLALNSTTISDSRLGAVTTYAVSFQPPAASLTTLIARADVKFCQEAGSWTDTCNAPAGLNVDAGINVGNVTINGGFGAGGGTAGSMAAVTHDSANSFHFTITPGTGTAETATAHTVTLSGVMTNPSGAGTYFTRVRTFSDAGGTAPIDQGSSAFAVLQGTTISGRVVESLTFTVGLVTAASACGTYENATVTSTVNTVPFGNFTSGTPRVGCQTVATATNADGGYATTIKEVNGGVAPQGGMCRQTATNCNAEGGQSGVSAADVIGDTVLNGTPAVWTPNTTFGLGFGVSGSHKAVAFTTNDTYRSLFGASAIPVSTYDDPTTAIASAVHVVFKADVSPVQTAGLYQNAIEYVTTPLF